MWIDLITLFPRMFKTLEYGITGRAIHNRLINLNYWNPRDYTKDWHRTVDDRPYGGGPGMVMKAEPVADAIAAAKSARNGRGHVIQMSPQGKRMTQQDIMHLASYQNIIIVASRYEGVDERLIDSHVNEQWSIGDYVLSGGEIPAMALVDAMCRLLPGALGNEQSALQDSFAAGLLDHPHYTRPELLNGESVPEVLLSGNHQAIARWRLKMALGRTWQRRPDMLKIRSLDETEKTLLDEFIAEQTAQSTETT